MKYASYLKESDIYMLSLYNSMDFAVAAEKMFSWDNLGEDNAAWKEGPYISSGANEKDIDHSKPYCIRLSDENSFLSNYILGPNPKIEKNGGCKMLDDRSLIKTTTIISTVAINMQFSLLEAFEFDTVLEYMTSNSLEKEKRQYNRSPVKKRLEIISNMLNKKIENELQNAYSSVSNFRNLLTHEPNILCGEPFTALDVYAVCQGVAYYLNLLFDGDCETIPLHRINIWENRIKKFTEETTFKNLTTASTL